MKKRFFSTLALMLTAAVAAGLFAGCSSSGSGDKQVVNILSANYEDQIALQLDYLREIYPDAEINITYMSSGKLAAKFQAEGADSEADILLSLSSGYANQLKDGGYLRSLTPQEHLQSRIHRPGQCDHPQRRLVRCHPGQHPRTGKVGPSGAHLL